MNDELRQRIDVRLHETVVQGNRYDAIITMILREAASYRESPLVGSRSEVNRWIDVQVRKLKRTSPHLFEYSRQNERVWR